MATRFRMNPAKKQELDYKFPGGGNQVVVRPLTNDIASARAGDCQVSDIPWVLRANRHLDKRIELANENKFDLFNTDEREKFSSLISESAKSELRDKELADYRIFELTSDVMASPFALGAFQNINLSAGELPAILTPMSRNLNTFTVRTISQNGGAREAQVRTSRSLAQYEMEMVSTDKVEYNLIDIQTGEVEEFEKVNQKLQYDLEIKIDKWAQDQLDAAKTTSGLRDLLNFHSLIDTSNLPDTNYIDLDAVDAGNTGVWTVQKLKALLDHIAKFGAVAGSGGVGESFTLSTIIGSPQNIRDPWDFIDLVSDFNDTDRVKPKETVPSSVRDSIFNTGMMASAWGFNWTWQPNGRISKGTGYALTTQPVGWYFTKSEFDRVIKWEGPDQTEQNYGQIMYQRVQRFLVPDLWKHRVVIFDL